MISVFFLPEKRQKWARSSFLVLFWLISRAEIGFLAHFFPLFWQFSRPFLSFSPTLLGLTTNFLGHNCEIFLSQKFFFFSVTFIFHNRLYVINPHSTGRKPPAAFFKNSLEERPFLVKKTQGTPQVQIKMKNTLKERPIFIKVCIENSHLGREPKYRKTNKPSRNCILHSSSRVFFSVFGLSLRQKFRPLFEGYLDFVLA